MANTKRLRRLTRVAITAVVLMMAVTADLMLSPDPTARAVDAQGNPGDIEQYDHRPGYRPPAHGGVVAV